MKNKSADEQHHIEEQYQKVKIDPGQVAVELIEEHIKQALSELGVDVLGNIPQQQADLGIIIVDTDSIAPHLQGFIVLKSDDGRPPYPVGFIGDARLQQKVVTVGYQNYRTGKLSEKSRRLP